MEKPDLTEYTVHKLVTHLTHREEFYGVFLYSNRSHDREPATDDRLLVARSASLDSSELMRLLNQVIEDAKQNPYY